MTEVYVDSVDSVKINGTYRKRINTSFPSRGFIEQWIEGIGCNNGLFYSGYYIFDYGYQLLCFHHNDSLYYLNSPNDSCYYITTNINDKNISLNNILIYPNPTYNKIYIESNIKLENAYMRPLRKGFLLPQRHKGSKFHKEQSFDYLFFVCLRVLMT